MRLFNFAVAVTAFSAMSPVANAMFGSIRIPKEMIPKKCQPTMEIAHQQGVIFDKWLKENVCQDHKVSFSQVKDYIDPVVKKYLTYIWSRLAPPLPLSEVLSFYRMLRKECIDQPKWGVVNNPNFCDYKEGDKKLSDMVNQCIIPKVAMKYMIKVPEFGDWLSKNCEKGEIVVKEILVDSKSNEKKGVPNPYMMVNACFKKWYNKLADPKTPSEQKKKSYPRCPF